jgi:two-component system, OmpR family, copper resistance phosphate regulon response regulator CusR
VTKILIAEDNEDLNQELVLTLKGEHYTVDTSKDGADALAFLRSYSYDLAILDWDLPNMTGIDVLKTIRSAGNMTPVIMLTGKSRLEEKETGLDTGADDYLTKPFLSRELLARIRSILRRSAKVSDNVLRVRDLVLDPKDHILTINGVEVSLFPIEFSLLEFFLRHPDQPFSSEALIERVWNSDSNATGNTVRTYVYTLRKKLTTHGYGNLIETIPRVGYKLISDVAP